MVIWLLCCCGVVGRGVKIRVDLMMFCLGGVGDWLVFFM